MVLSQYSDRKEIMTDCSAKYAAHHRSHVRHHILPELSIHVGDIHVSRTPVKIKTILGSCISACLFDPTTHIGGMNHFLLPGDIDNTDLSTRYGINAMEVLINEMMKLGANRKFLKAKIFGGGDIFRTNHTLMMVGKKNINFVRSFLATENISIVNEKVGGNNGLIVHFHTQTSEAFIRSVPSGKYHQTQMEELEYRERITKNIAREQQTNVTLF